MTAEMIEKLGNRMVTLIRVVNMYGLSGNKLANELRGMTMALKAMEVDYNFEYNNDADRYTAVIIEGNRFEV